MCFLWSVRRVAGPRASGGTFIAPRSIRARDCRASARAAHDWKCPSGALPLIVVRHRLSFWCCAQPAWHEVPQAPHTCQVDGEMQAARPAEAPLSDESQSETEECRPVQPRWPDQAPRCPIGFRSSGRMSTASGSPCAVRFRGEAGDVGSACVSRGTVALTIKGAGEPPREAHQ